MTRDNDEKALLVASGIALLVKPFTLNFLSSIDFFGILVIAIVLRN